MITIDNITKTYPSGRGMVPALNEVSLVLPRGTMLAVAGKSGSGKTTLLNCIGGLEQPDSGTISLFGVEMNKLSKRQISLFQRQHLGFVFQFGNLLPFLTVSQNIEFPLVLNKKPVSERVAFLLEKMELAHAGNALVSELSGGEMQRISFARAIAHSPKLLLADEPTANLDTETGNLLVEMMSSLVKEENISIIFTTHDDELIKRADQSIKLLDGRIIV